MVLTKLFRILASLALCALAGGGTASMKTHSWAVKLSSRVSLSDLNSQANALAKECGVINMGPIGSMDNIFEFGMRANDNQSGSIDHLAVEESLSMHSAVQWAAIQRPLKRVGRSFRDPYFLKQWHLVS